MNLLGKVLQFIFSAILCFSLGLALLVISFFLRVAKGDDFIELNNANIEYKSYLEGSHYHLITDNQHLLNPVIDKGINLNINMNAAGFIFWNNSIQANTDMHQFRTIAWDYSLGARINDSLSIQYHHRSEHTLDVQYQDSFPWQDSVGFTYTIYQQKHPTFNNTLF